MITPLELYFVLQLDNIKVFLCEASKILFVINIVAIILAFGDFILSRNHEKRYLVGSIAALLLLTIPLAACQAMLPGTKQMATILILPKIASEENVDYLTQEAKELYSIAKEGLKNSIKEKDQTK